MDKTDGRRVKAETAPIFPGEDDAAPLHAAVNTALNRHIEAVTASMSTALHDQLKFVKIEIPPGAARKFVLDEYDRPETMSSDQQGSRSFIKKFALVEFPESVDQIAVQQIRQSVQQDRIASLGMVLGCAWLSIFSAGIGIRQMRKESRFCRWLAGPVFAVVAIPALLFAIGLALSLSRGNVPHAPWNSQSVTIELPDV